MKDLKDKSLLAQFIGYANKRPLTDSLLRSLFNDYNSLMPVVEKVESMGYVVEIKGIYVKTYSQNGDIISFMVCGDHSQKLHIISQALVQLVEWYFENNKLTSNENR